MTRITHENPTTAHSKFKVTWGIQASPISYLTLKKKIVKVTDRYVSSLPCWRHQSLRDVPIDVIFKWEQAISCQTAARGLQPFRIDNDLVDGKCFDIGSRTWVKCHSFEAGRGIYGVASLDRSSENCILRLFKDTGAGRQSSKGAGIGRSLIFQKKKSGR